MLGISKKELKKYGAVSSEIAEAMAKSALVKANADIGIGIAGIAGPGGATKNKKIREVYAVLYRYNKSKILQRRGDKLSYPIATPFSNATSRENVRLASVDIALNLLLQELELV